MAARRTQIYLSREQREALDELVRRQGRPLAEIIRAAVDAYLADSRPDPEEALRQTFGALPDLAAPPREDWSNRDARLPRG